MGLISYLEHAFIRVVRILHIDFQILLKSVNWLHVSSN